jgi:hypothetical protein
VTLAHIASPEAGYACRHLHLTGAWAKKFLFRFYVHQYLGNAVHLSEHTVLDKVRDDVSSTNAQISIHDHMKINVVPEPHLAYETLIQSADTRN